MKKPAAEGDLGGSGDEAIGGGSYCSARPPQDINAGRAAGVAVLLVPRFSAPCLAGPRLRLPGLRLLVVGMSVAVAGSCQRIDNMTT